MERHDIALLTRRGPPTLVTAVHFPCDRRGSIPSRRKPPLGFTLSRFVAGPLFGHVSSACKSAAVSKSIALAGTINPRRRSARSRDAAYGSRRGLRGTSVRLWLVTDHAALGAHRL